jgi:dipeptidyl aminopeptidase/acylaminoacyl peptidase
MRRALMLMSAVLLFAAAAAPATPRPLEPADLFRVSWASDPQIRRDGTQIVYVREHNDVATDEVLQSLWLVDAATGAQRPLTRTAGHYESPRWSPDGTKIAYVETAADGRSQIVVQWLGGGTATITRLTEKPTDITWSPDGTRIAFIALEPASAPTIGKPLAKPDRATWAPGPVITTDMNFRADGFGRDPYGYRHLHVVSIEGGGTPVALTSGPFSDAGPLAWSPDGRSIYFATNLDEGWKRLPEDWARHTAMTLSIYRVDASDRKLVQLSREVGPYHAPRVSPDGKQIAFLGYRDRHVGHQGVRLNVMNADGSGAREVGASLDRSLTDCQWAADGKSLYVQYVDRGVTRVARLGLDGKLDPLPVELAEVGGPEMLPYSGGAFTVSGKGTIAYTGAATDRPPELYLWAGGKSRRLTDLNAELLEDAKVGPLQPLAVKSFDGRELGAWMVLPPGFDPAKKYPAILEIHGGPYASYGPVFSLDYQLYAAAGYVVVFGNPRGSTSYGEEFANTIYNNYPSQDYDDLMSIVDAAVATGHVDPDNLFVTGSSGGGVLTTWIVGKTDRFKAAVTQRPVVNWTSWLLTADMGSFGARYWFKKLPWEDPETYWKHSPISLVGNVRTPTMVIVGLSDLRTPVPEAEQYYQALQLKGVPTYLYQIPGASHVAIKPSQFAQQTNAILEWFERYRAPATH